MILKLLALIIAAGIAFNGAVLLLWLACRQIIRARKPPSRCPCGCGRTGPDTPSPGLPVDGIPLDDYMQRQFDSVLLSYLNSPDGDGVREDH